MSVNLLTIQSLLLLAGLLVLANQSTAQIQKRQKPDNVVAEMQVVCLSNAIVLKLNTNSPFNGMVYAKDAPNNNNCMSEFNSATNMTFRLPLKSCGTLFADADDGIEYFNTVVVQPHMRLMTNQGKGYHIRCKYQTRERTIANTHFNVSASFLMQNNQQAISAPLLATASMPSCTMKIFRSGRDDVAEAVKIGDKLIMVIEIDQQDMYGMRITNCVVRDGLNMAEQQLINDAGCPVDEAIMPKFEYTNNSTRAAVSFPAHKFPHTSSVYYQCNVRLCINNGGCDLAECNNSLSNNSNPRKKRFVGHHVIPNVSTPVKRSDNLPVFKDSPPPVLPSPSALTATKGKDGSDVSFDVYSGLYVSDIDVGESDSSNSNVEQLPSLRHTDQESRDKEVCLGYGQISLLMVVASVFIVGVILMLLCQVGLFGRDHHTVESRIISPDEHNHHQFTHLGKRLHHQRH